jgi:cobalt/nickel transport system permease protein
MVRAFFIVVLFALLLIRNYYYYLPIIALLNIVAFKDALKLNKRVIISIFLFNFAVTIGYIIMAYLKGFVAWEYLIYINLKVYTITLFVMLFFSRVNVVKFFEFSKSLSYMLTITLSMIYSYKKSLFEFKDAIKARGGIEDFEFLKRVFAFFLKKAMSDSKERALALKARGFFDD